MTVFTLASTGPELLRDDVPERAVAAARGLVAARSALMLADDDADPDRLRETLGDLLAATEPWPVVATGGVLEPLTIDAVELGAIRLPATRRWVPAYAPGASEDDREVALLAVSWRQAHAVIQNVGEPSPYPDFHRAFDDAVAAATRHGLRRVATSEADVFAFPDLARLHRALSAIEAALAAGPSASTAAYAVDHGLAPMRGGRATGAHVHQLMRMVSMAKARECLAPPAVAIAWQSVAPTLSTRPCPPLHIKGRRAPIELVAVDLESLAS